jgi:hypothetical protein
MAGLDWEPNEQKGKRPIKLSIPPAAITIFERIARGAKAATSINFAWAFPQLRNKYLLAEYSKTDDHAGIQKYDKHITTSSLNHCLDALAGRKKGVVRSASDRGVAGPQWSTRPQTFGAHFFDNRGLGSYASALLDHPRSLVSIKCPRRSQR